MYKESANGIRSSVMMIEMEAWNFNYRVNILVLNTSYGLKQSQKPNQLTSHEFIE